MDFARQVLLALGQVQGIDGELSYTSTGRIRHAGRQLFDGDWGGPRKLSQAGEFYRPRIHMMLGKLQKRGLTEGSRTTQRWTGQREQVWRLSEAGRQLLQELAV